MKTLKIALVGQPNVGKSMLINSISNAKLRVGNFSGVTVEKEEVFFEYEGHKIEIIDLPGTYSLNEFTQEEKVTKNFLLNEKYDVILNVVDSTALERNLYLTTELLELNQKMIVALNMSDEAQKEGIEIDVIALEEILGVPCVSVSAKTNIGINKLISRLVELSRFEVDSSKVIYSEAVEEELATIATFLDEKGFKGSWSNRQIALKILKGDPKIYKSLHEEPIFLELSPLIKDGLEHLYLHHQTKNVAEIFDSERSAFAKGAVNETVKFKKHFLNTMTEKIDSVLINKIFGIPIFLFLMWGLFQVTFEVGAIPMDAIDAIFVNIAERTKEFLGDGWLSSLIADGAIAGVGAVVMFLPNIMILFLGIALLETTGYMARVAFLLDGFFHKFGLHGKSFIPLVTGFGCTVPAYMAARMLKSEKDRLVTLFILSFMSCGARLPVYVLFVGAFFGEENAGNVLFAIYLAGAMFGLFSALFLKKIFFKGKDEPFVMEMPKYRLPSFKLVWHTVYTKSLMYLKKAGTFILAASVFVWFASNYPKSDEIGQKYETLITQAADEEAKKNFENEFAKAELENSLLGRIGKSTEFFFEPLGLDWKLAVALETGLAAKEVIVSTIGVLYSLGGDAGENDEGLLNELRKNITIPQALSFITFVLLYMPCFAATAVFTKESGKVKYTVYLFLFTTAAAWIMSFVVFHISTVFAS